MRTDSIFLLKQTYQAYQELHILKRQTWRVVLQNKWTSPYRPECCPRKEGVIWNGENKQRQKAEMSHVEKNVLFCCHSFLSGLLNLMQDPKWSRQTIQEKYGVWLTMWLHLDFNCSVLILDSSWFNCPMVLDLLHSSSKDVLVADVLFASYQRSV